MTLPNNYNPTPLAPQIIISRRGVELYRWEHPQISDAPTQDFNLENWAFRSGINTDAGNASIVIPDHDLQLAPQEQSPFEPGDMVSISLGKNPGNLQKYWAGEIKESRLINGGTNKQKLEFSCIGQINELAYRYTNIDFAFSDFATNPASRISEILKRIINGEGLLLPDDLDVTQNISDIDIRLPHYQHHNRTIKSIIADLAKIGNAVYGLTPDRELFFGIPEQSDFVISSIGEHQTESDAYLHNVAYGSHKSHLTDGYGRVITLGLTSLNYVEQRSPDTFWNLHDDNIPDVRIPFGTGLIPDSFHSLQIYLSLNIRWIGPGNQQGSLSETSRYFSSARIYKSDFALPERITNEPFLDLDTSTTSPPITNFDSLPTNRNDEHWTGWVSIFQPATWDDFHENKFMTIVMIPRTQTLRRFIGFSPVGHRIAQIGTTRLHTYGTHGSKKEYIENAEGQDFETAKFLAEKFLEESAKGRQVLDAITIGPPSRMPPLGKKITMHDAKSGRIIKPVLMGYDVSGSMATRNLAHKMQLSVSDQI